MDFHHTINVDILVLIMIMSQSPTHVRTTLVVPVVTPLTFCFACNDWLQMQTQWHSSNLNFGRRSSTQQIKCDQITPLNDYVLGKWNGLTHHFVFDFFSVLSSHFYDSAWRYAISSVSAIPFHPRQCHTRYTATTAHVCKMLCNQRKKSTKRNRRKFFVSLHAELISDATRDGGSSLRNLTTRHLQRVLTDVKLKFASHGILSLFFDIFSFSGAYPLTNRTEQKKKKNNEPTKALTIRRATATNKSVAFVLLV